MKRQKKKSPKALAKKKHEEHENHERWIIPYADMVTLLFAFFVVMYAMSQSDKEKMKIVSEAVSDAFIGNKKGGDRTRQLDVTGIKGSPPTARRFVVRRSITNEELLDEIRRALDVQGFDVIYQTDASPIQLRIDERGLIISLSAGYLFEPNSTEIPLELYPVIQIVADIIKSNDRLISVEGHTDSTTVKGKSYYDNWDLSALRATAMARLLIEEFGISPKRIHASGYAQYKPIATNDTETGRAQNRRVDIVMLNASSPEDLVEDPSIPGLENSAKN